MRSNPTIVVKSKQMLILLFSISCFLLALPSAVAQKLPEKPPKPIKLVVSVLQHLDFGKIAPTGSAGFVTIPPSGVTTSSNVVLIGSTTTPALIDVESLPGTRIQIGFPANATLTGSGGGTLNLRNFTSDYAPSFISTIDHTLVHIGGTLDVGLIGANPAGSYGGTFLVTFTQIYQ